MNSLSSCPYHGQRDWSEPIYLKPVLIPYHVNYILSFVFILLVFNPINTLAFEIGIVIKVWGKNISLKKITLSRYNNVEVE